MMFSTKAEYGVRVMVELAREPARTRSRWRRSPTTTASRSPTWSTSSRACARPGWWTRGAARGADTCSPARPPRSRWPRWWRRWRARSRRSSASPRPPTDRSCARASRTPDTSARRSCCGRGCGSRSCAHCRRRCSPISSSARRSAADGDLARRRRAGVDRHTTPTPTPHEWSLKSGWPTWRSETCTCASRSARSCGASTSTSRAARSTR